MTTAVRKFGTRKYKFLGTCHLIFATLILWIASTYFFDEHAAVLKSRNARSSSVKLSSLSLQDSCTKRNHTCEVQSKNFSYVYFLTSPSSPAVSTAGSPKEFYENLSYFDYTFASISRLSDLTNLPILVMVTHDLSEMDASGLRGISPRVMIKQVSPGYLKFSINTTKKRHIHTFGKYEVFNPENTLNFERLVFMDMDTFALKNVDELFCSPSGSLAVAKRELVRDPSGFNSGVFAFTPSQKDYDDLMSQVQNNQHKTWKNGEQTLLNLKYKKRLFCLSTGYNCLGFMVPNSAKSTKCSIFGTSDSEVWAKRQIVHAKFSDERVASSIPTITQKWESYLPRKSIHKKQS